MKTPTVLFFSLLILFACCNCNNLASTTVKGSGNITSTVIPVGNYTSIENTGSCQIIYEQKKDAEPYLRLEIDDNLKDNIIITSKNGKLKISSKGSMNPTTYKVYTNSRTLSFVQTTGSGSVQLGKIQSADNLSLSITGSGKIKSYKTGVSGIKINVAGSGGVELQDISCKNINASVSGSGYAKLNGSAKEGKLSVSGSGSVSAFDLKCKDVYANIAGSGNAKVYASENLTARIHGSGQIVYAGSPKYIDRSVQGSGKISRK